MPYYISKYVEIKPNVHAPIGSGQPGWKSIDLRPDGGATLGGGGLNACLLWLPVADPDIRLTLIGLDILDTQGPALMTAINAKLGTNYTFTTIRNFIIQCMTSPPANGWKAVKHDARGGMEIILNGVLPIV